MSSSSEEPRPVVQLLLTDRRDTIKMLRETFCLVQHLVNQSGDPRRKEHSDRLQRLIADCDVQRPLGPDGKHGNRHTLTCGCYEEVDRG